MKVKRKEKKEKPVREKPISGKKIGNRTVIGIVCVLIAFAVCFLVAPLVNGTGKNETEIVRIKQTVTKGSRITEEDVEAVAVGVLNLPTDVIQDRENVVGKYATVDLYAGDYLLPGKLTSDVGSATDILEALAGGQKAISLSIGSFAQGLSGKLETGDIISVIVYNAKDGTVETPPELQYVKVITSTTLAGVDKEDVTNAAQPVTVTLLVNQTQAELLALYEKTVSMHFALEYRGGGETAQRYLDVQTRYFESGEGET